MEAKQVEATLKNFIEIQYEINAKNIHSTNEGAARAVMDLGVILACNTFDYIILNSWVKFPDWLTPILGSAFFAVYLAAMLFSKGRKLKRTAADENSDIAKLLNNFIQMNEATTSFTNGMSTNIANKL